MQPSPIPEALIAAYRATDYTSRVNDLDEVMKIGEAAVWLTCLFDAYRVSTALFITADALSAKCALRRKMLRPKSVCARICWIRQT